VIEDLEGATTEWGHRRHVLVLSAASAALSLALLVTLLVPMPRADMPVPAAAPAPSASAQTVMTVTSNPVSQLRLDLTRDSLCPDGTRLIPPYGLAVDAAGEAIFAVRSDGYRWTRAVPVVVVPIKGTSWLMVTCATSGDVAPLIGR
jgi:hypothetical protein